MRHPQRAAAHPQAGHAGHAGHAGDAGFTLVEVLVALLVMAILAALAWRGLDTILRSRDVSRDAVDRTMRLATVMAQWEEDLSALQGELPVPTLKCDGRSLRLVRRSEGAVRLVTWSLNGSTWQRWVSAPATRVGELQEAWLRSLQLQGSEPDQLKLLEGVTGWQVTYYRPRDNTWSNCQSSADVAAPLQSAAGAAGAPAASVREELPTGVRLVLQLDGKTLTRDVEIQPAS